MKRLTTRPAFIGRPWLNRKIDAPVSKAGWVLSLALAFSCTVEEAEPREVRTAKVLLPAPPATLGENLRYAVAWVEGDSKRLLLTDQGELAGPAFDVRFSLPDDVQFDRLSRVEQLTLFRLTNAYRTPSSSFVGPTLIYTPAYRPRIIVYDDLDGDQRLDIAGDPQTADHIVATDGFFGMAALVDPKQALRDMTLAEASRFYELNDEFSRFVFSVSTGATFETTAPSPIVLELGTPLREREDVICGRMVTHSQQFISSTVIVDASIDPRFFCSGVSVVCQSEALTSLEAPVLSNDFNVTRSAQCHQSALEESLVVTSGTIECSHCSCSTEGRLHVYVAPRSRLPAWWPCGTDVKYCNRGASLTRFDSTCVLQSGDDDPIPALDAGIPAADAGADSDAARER